MDLNPTIYLANKYAHVTEAVSKGMSYVPGGTFLQPIFRQLNKDELTEPYRQHVWTYASIGAIALAAQRVPMLLIREKDIKGGHSAKSILRNIRNIRNEHKHKLTPQNIYDKGFEPIESGPVYDLFDKPNPLMCRSQLIESLVILLYLTGAAFWVLDAGSDTNNAVSIGELPKEIWTFGQNWFEPVIDKNTGYPTAWKRNKREGFPEVTFQPHQIIRFYKYNPYGMFSGLAPYDVAHRPASQDFKAQVFNENFFDNGATPQGFITVPGGVYPEEGKQMLKEFNSRHQGYKNSHKMGMLYEGAEIKWNPQTHHDMEFMEGRKWNRDESFAAYGVPKMKAAIYEDLQLATALAADKAFWIDTVIPNLHYFEDMINSRLFNGSTKETRGLYTLFDLSGVEALRADMDSKSTIADKFFKMGVPFNRLNERLELGFEPVKWGDVGWLPMGMNPVDENFTIDDYNSVDGVAGDETDYNEPEKTIPKDLETKAKTKVRKSKRWIDAVFSPIEAPFQGKIKKYWSDLRNEQIKIWNEATGANKSLTKAIPTYEDLEKILFSNKQWQENLRVRVRPFYNQTANFAMDLTFQDLGTQMWEFSDPRIQAVLRLKENKIVGVTDRFWNRLKESLIDGIGSGDTLAGLTDRIKAEFNFAASASRTLTIARTETAQVASPLRHIILAGEGVTRCDWSDSGDEHVRGDHLILNNLGPKPIDHNYMTDLKGSGTLTHPSDPRGPANQVINCRCLEIAED